jgi:hypothetical protein
MQDIAANYHPFLMTRNCSFIFSFILLPGLLFLLSGCSHNHSETEDGFWNIPESRMVEPGFIDEASGVADSKANPGYLWVEQDGGNPNDITLLSYTGNIAKRINIRSAVNRDWEDIVLAGGPDPGINYLYIADIGDNNSLFSNYSIYRFQEPLLATDTVSVYDRIRFAYPNGSHDAEAFLVDHTSKDIYLFTKQESGSRIYKLTYPQSTTAINTAIYIGTIPINKVVSAAASATSDELLIKTYTSLYYWKRASNESIEQTMQKDPVMLDYQLEPQGEALCFKNDNSGFYTLSERPVSIAEIFLNFYKRR